IGELDQAVAALNVNLAIRRELHDLQGEGVVLGYLGRIAQSRARLDEAERYCREALKIHQEIHDPREESVDLASLGEIFQTRGQYNGSLLLWEFCSIESKQAMFPRIPSSQVSSAI